jgi:hypothetical protein
MIASEDRRRHPMQSFRPESRQQLPSGSAKKIGVIVFTALRVRRRAD